MTSSYNWNTFLDTVVKEYGGNMLGHMAAKTAKHYAKKGVGRIWRRKWFELRYNVT